MGVWDIMREGKLRVKHVNGHRPIQFPVEPLYEPIFRQAFEGGHRRFIILKARRMYFTTHCILASLTYAALRPNATNYFINWSLAAGEKVFRDAFQFIMNHNSGLELGDPVMFREGEWQKNCVIFNKYKRNESQVVNLQSSRSGGGNLAHITDYARMAQEDPRLAREVLEGTLGSMPNGIALIESTSASPVGGFSDIFLADQDRQKRGIPRGDSDFWCMFFPWYERELNCLRPEKIPGAIQKMKADAEYMDYYYQQSAKCPNVPEERWAWHHEIWGGDIMARRWGSMFQEHPTTPEEAFLGDSKALLLSDTMRNLRENGSIGFHPPDNSLVYVSFDLGSGKTAWTAMTFWQVVSNNSTEGLRLRVIDFYKAQQSDWEHYNMQLRSRSHYNIAAIILPWDAAAKNMNAVNLTNAKDMTVEQKVKSMGWHNVHVMEKNSKNESIETANWALKRTVFNKANPSVGGRGGLIEMLESLRREMDSQMILRPDIQRDAQGSVDAYDSLETGARYFREKFRGHVNQADWSGYWENWGQMAG